MKYFDVESPILRPLLENTRLGKSGEGGSEGDGKEQ
jgi:hypothetical protein